MRSDMNSTPPLAHIPLTASMPAIWFPEVLIYCDPPYVFETRTSHVKQQYSHEMTDADHVQLLEALDDHPGPVLLSGYPCTLYDKRLQHWRRETIAARDQKGGKREEVLWINKSAVKQQISLF